MCCRRERQVTEPRALFNHFNVTINFCYALATRIGVNKLLNDEQTMSRGTNPSNFS